MGAKLKPWQISLRGVLAFVLVASAIIALAAFGVASREEAYFRKSSIDCKNNLKQLGVYLSLYVQRYGGGTEWPGCEVPAGGVGGGFAAGPNGAFWSHLWRLPAGAISRRPGEDALFQCTVRRRRLRAAITPSALDYAGPALERVEDFPGGRLSDRVAAQTFIGGDLCLPGDPNHAGTRVSGRGFPSNALRFDGSVKEVQPGSPETATYERQTNALTGVRTP